MSGCVHDCELERQKRKGGMQALKKCVPHCGLARYKCKPRISPLAQTAKQSESRRAVFYYQSEPQIKNYIPPPAE